MFATCTRRACVLVRVVAMSALMLPFACDDASEDGREAPTEATLGPDGGTVVHLGARLGVPSGALVAPTDIAIVTADPAVPLPAGMDADSQVFRFTPHGLAFSETATISLPFDGVLGGLTVLVLDGPDDDAWDPVPGAAFADGNATFPVSHLSDYVVAGIAGSSPAVVAAIAFPGGRPDALLVNGAQELVVFDADTDNDVGRPHLRFIQADRDDDHGTFAFDVSPDALPVAWTTGIPKGWMVRDPNSDLVYVLAVNGRTTDARIGWDQVWVHVVSGHAEVGAFSFNPDGGKPSGAPEDFRFVPAGLALKPAGSESGNAARVFVHEIVGGNVEVLDLDAAGTALASRERFSYRDRIEDGCTWPPAPDPWDCHWLGTIGNTLALKWYLANSIPPGLPGHDLLYLTDHNVSGTDVLLFQVTQADPVVLTPLPEIDMTAADDVLTNGIEGLTAGHGDTLFVATGLQSFEDGLIGTIDAATQAPGVIRIPFGDRGDPALDPSDPRRVFVAASDAFAQQPALLVHELVDGAVEQTVQVLAPHDEARVSSMAYDPRFGLLYLAVGDRILAVRMRPGW